MLLAPILVPTIFIKKLTQMKGNSELLIVLNSLLADELTAINRYQK